MRRVAFVLIGVLSSFGVFAAGAEPVVLPNMFDVLVKLAQVGSLGVAVLALFLAYNLIRSGRPAGLFLSCAIAVFAIASGIEITKYLKFSDMRVQVQPTHFPSTIPRPHVSNDAADLDAVEKVALLSCSPNALVTFNIEDLVDMVKDLRAATRAPAVLQSKKAGADVGADLDAGGAP